LASGRGTQEENEMAMSVVQRLNDLDVPKAAQIEINNIMAHLTEATNLSAAINDIEELQRAFKLTGNSVVADKLQSINHVLHHFWKELS
jgi:hypothetical protein